jgi:fructoselysine 3-epimerase
MKISILSSLFWRYPLEKVFEIASLQGYDGVEVWGARPHAYAYDMNEARIDRLLKLKEQYRLDIPMYCPEILMYPYNIPTLDPKERRDTIDYLKRSIEVAKAIGSPRIQMTSGHAGYGTDRKINLENITSVMRILVDCAEKIGVDIIFEILTIMESNTIFLLDDLLDVMNRIGSPRLKGMIDTVMPMTNWETFSEYFEKLGDKMAYIHFEDTNGVNQFHQPIGKGILDMPELIAMFRRYGYDGWLSFELFSSYIREPEMYSGQEIRKLRSILLTN